MGEDVTIPQKPAAKGRPNLPKRYRVGEVIGEGGMGRVYRAHDTTLGRDVAIKVIEGELAPGPDQTQQRERFVREARAAARILHPAIAVVHDVDPEAGWLVMELVDGQSLREVAAKGPLEPRLVRVIAAQVLAGLVAAHAGGVIHRDIKPSNIILGDGNRVKLVDFGVARLVDADMTRTGEHLGTPAYMAPEQVRGGETDARTDLYGLGATLYELVTGQRLIAFESPNEATMQRLEAACKDPTLSKLIARCLQADPDARFPSAAAALEVLSTVRMPGASGQFKRKKPPYAVAFAGVALVAAIGAVAWWKLRETKAVDPRPAQAFTLAQRGEHERAGDMLEGYLAEHPDDGDALAIKLLCDWWQTGVIEEITKRAVDAKLRPASRAMIHGIELIAQRRENEAAAYLARAEREHPNSPEIIYALGEAQWHGQHYEEGATTLERAFTIDPRWQMALHHVTEFRLTRGESARLVPIAERLRPLDPASAAALDCKIAIGERRYADAAKFMPAKPIAENYICLAQAQILAGELDAAMATAKQAMDLAPIDLREFGGFSIYAELYLYRGRFKEYLDLVRSKPSRQRSLAVMWWTHDANVGETTPNGTGMRMPPIGAATWIDLNLIKGTDVIDVYRDYPEAEIRYYGAGLWAEQRGEFNVALEQYRKGLAVPAKGDMRMLFGHHIARILVKLDERAGAIEACQEVIAPRMYQVYRALLLPDCLLWSGREQQLVDAWTGEFDHPAVAEARRRLAAHP